MLKSDAYASDERAKKMNKKNINNIGPNMACEAQLGTLSECKSI